jgi:arylsulfatase A-like enzyme
MRLLTLSFSLIALLSTSQAKPNIVFFLVDDLGYMDIGAYNPDTFYETPNINRLASSGVRFTDGYAANPVCSPTRYSIMTGKYPSRAGTTNWFSGRRSGRFNPAPLHSNMPLAEVTLAEALKQADYQTAFLGKWHLGPTEEFWPKKQGFDINLGGHNRGSPPGGYFSPYKNPRLKNEQQGEYLTERLAREASDVMSAFHAKGEPFLIYLSFYNVHTPLQAPKNLVAKYQKKAQGIGGEEFGDEEQVWPGGKKRRVRILQKHATYAAMVESMDTAVGRVLNQVRKLGIEKDTIICFTSDNGGLSTSEGSPTSNLPLRGGKGWIYEGGIREPYIISYPSVVKPGVCTYPVISNDFYPTLLELAGLPLQKKQHLDGVSLLPLLKDNKSTINREALYWHYPHYSNQGGFPGGAIRSGSFKLVERYENGKASLYDLKEDPGERRDLAEKMPDRVKALRPKLHEWYREVGAKFLTVKGNSGEPWHPPGS